MIEKSQLSKDTQIEERLSIRNERLEGESFEDYKRRQKIVNKSIRLYRRGKMFHVSSILIPKMDKDGKIVTGLDGRPIWIGQTPGRTYIKLPKL